MEIIRGNVKVGWVELGEGWYGEYNEEDPNDEELLRFDVHTKINGEWEPVEDSSYCTAFPVNTSFDQQADASIIIMNSIEEPLLAGYSIKKICEELSWISPYWLKNFEYSPEGIRIK